jgi:two-component system nitrogen regulation response regulator NtrX
LNEKNSQEAIKLSRAKILIVDDERNILSSLKTALSLEDFSVVVAGSGEIGLEKLEQEAVDLVLLDVKMPGLDGLETLRRIKRNYSGLPIVMMSGHGTIQTALEAIRLGAIDFVEKPLTTERLFVTLQNALQLDRLERENLEMRAGLEEEFKIVGESRAINEVHEQIRFTGPSQSRVLIHGENGTGKELVARAIHAASPRADKPFVKVNCAAIPSELIESELFGHVKGAFTGALAARKGKFVLADGGIIFLDEIGDMKLDMQSKLLRVLQEGEFEPVGSEDTVKVDVRVISATNRVLENLIREEKYRQDLYYRLAVIPINVPPLRERLDDIPLLIDYFSELICRENHRPKVAFAPEVPELLKTHTWPGNVRELKNIVERLIILSKEDLIGTGEVAEVLPTTTVAPDSSMLISGKPLKYLVSDFEKLVIEKALKRNAHHVSKTASELGLERSHLYKKMRAYGISPR